MKSFRVFAGFVPLVVFLLLWEMAVVQSERGRFLFGSPSLIIAAALSEFQSGSIWKDIGITALESGMGLILGTLLGSVAALCLWLSRSLADIAKPYITFLGAVPIFAISPMLIIWFGTGLLPKVAMAFFSVFLLVLVRVFQGAQDIDLMHSEWLLGINANRRLALREVVIPESISLILKSMRMSVGLAFLGAFIGEFVVADAGLGYFVLKNGGVYDIPRVILGVILFGVLALLFGASIDLVSSRMGNAEIAST